MQIEVTLEGRKQLLDTTRAIDRELVKGIRGELSAGARLIRRDARRMVAPQRFTGNLEDSVRVRTWRDHLSATVYVGAPHKYLFRYGRQPGKMPDIRKEAFKAYAKARGIPEKKLFALARAIGQKGTKPSVAFMQIASMVHQAGIERGLRIAIDRVFETEGGTR